VKLLDAFDYLYKSDFKLPVFEPITNYRGADFAPCSIAETPPHIDVRKFLIPIKVHLDSQDKHIEQLLGIVEEAERIGLRFPSLEKYIRSHRNDLYEYAKYKGWRAGWLENQILK